MRFDLCHLGGSNGGKKYPLLQKGAQYLMLNFTLLGRVSWKIADGGLRWFVISFYCLFLFFLEASMFPLTDFEWEQGFYIKIICCYHLLLKTRARTVCSFYSMLVMPLNLARGSMHKYLRLRSPTILRIYLVLYIVAHFAINLCTVYAASYLTCTW